MATEAFWAPYLKDCVLVVQYTAHLFFFFLAFGTSVTHSKVNELVNAQQFCYHRVLLQ